MAADSDRVVFRNQRIRTRVYPNQCACDSFIYKHAADVIRISFNTLHLLFTSRIPATRKPMSECVYDPFCLSKDKYIFTERNIFSCLTSEKSIDLVSYLTILSPFYHLVRLLSSHYCDLKITREAFEFSNRSHAGDCISGVCG